MVRGELFLLSLWNEKEFTVRKWMALASFALSLNAGTALAGFDDNAKLENQTPPKALLKRAQNEYIRYCSACHAKDGTGRDAPALKGSLIATGPMGGNIHMVITGGPHTRMPAWGLTGLSDRALADMLTYVRNAWGNDNKKQFGKHAGGVITEELVKKYREALPKQPWKKDITT